jgi:hypothetical protein
VRRALAGVALGLALLCWTPVAHASLLGGVGKILSGIITLPLSIIKGTVTGPPIIGTLFGAVNGTLTGVSMVAKGLFEVTGSALPLALKLAPIFL